MYATYVYYKKKKKKSLGVNLSSAISGRGSDFFLPFFFFFVGKILLLFYHPTRIFSFFLKIFFFFLEVSGMCNYFLIFFKLFKKSKPLFVLAGPQAELTFIFYFFSFCIKFIPRIQDSKGGEVYGWKWFVWVEFFFFFFFKKARVVVRGTSGKRKIKSASLCNGVRITTGYIAGRKPTRYPCQALRFSYALKRKKEKKKKKEKTFRVHTYTLINQP